MNSTYTVVLPDYLHTHFGQTVTLFRDRTNPRDPKLDAYVRSGDYFILLSTMLENLASELPETSLVATGLALSRLADELLYIQKHYQIVPKKRGERLDEIS